MDNAITAAFGLFGVVIGAGLGAALDERRDKRLTRARLSESLFAIGERADNLRKALAQQDPASTSVRDEREHLGTDSKALVDAIAANRHLLSDAQLDVARSVARCATDITIGGNMDERHVLALTSAVADAESKLQAVRRHAWRRRASSSGQSS